MEEKTLYPFFLKNFLYNIRAFNKILTINMLRNETSCQASASAKTADI